MARLPRLDAPGLLQHVIGRGIERRPIFGDDLDKQVFLKRLADLLTETHTPCYAWCLMDNHFHLLIKTSDVPLSKLMNRLLGGYSLYFNKQHKRAGHLFQNRYKSFVCQEETYLLTLIRYIHLNPLRAGIVENLKALPSYPFSGHLCLIGEADLYWQVTDEVLAFFGKTLSSARDAYVSFVADPANDQKSVYPERDAMQWGEQEAFDGRILGGSDFKQALIPDILDLRVNSIEPKALIILTADLLGIAPDLIKSSSKARQAANARAIVAYTAQKIRITGASLAKEIGVTEACISRSAQRGAALLSERPDLKAELIKMLRC